jgi:succinyl-diaminopimelate desuccinylase
VAYPELTDNPVRSFGPVLNTLLEKEWDSGNRHFPPTSFEVVSLDAGTGALNVTPPQLKASFNFRYSTEWDHDGLIEAVERVFDAHGVDAELEWQLQGEPFLTARGQLVDAAVDAIRDVTGIPPELSTSGGTSDGRFIAPAGAEVVEIGPVNASIHKVDEHVRLADLPALVDIYRKIPERLFLGD